MWGHRAAARAVLERGRLPQAPVGVRRYTHACAMCLSRDTTLRRGSRALGLGQRRLRCCGNHGAAPGMHARPQALRGVSVLLQHPCLWHVQGAVSPHCVPALALTTPRRSVLPTGEQIGACRNPSLSPSRALNHVSRSMTAWLVSRLRTPRSMILRTISALPCAARARLKRAHPRASSKESHWRGRALRASLPTPGGRSARPHR